MSPVARHYITSSQALDMLRRLSRDRHQTLAEVAAEVIGAGQRATPKSSPAAT